MFDPRSEIELPPRLSSRATAASSFSFWASLSFKSSASPSGHRDRGNHDLHCGEDEQRELRERGKQDQRVVLGSVVREMPPREERELLHGHAAPHRGGPIAILGCFAGIAAMPCGTVSRQIQVRKRDGRARAPPTRRSARRSPCWDLSCSGANRGPGASLSRSAVPRAARSRLLPPRARSRTRSDRRRRLAYTRPRGLLERGRRRMGPSGRNCSITSSWDTSGRAELFETGRDEPGAIGPLRSRVQLVERR